MMHIHSHTSISSHWLRIRASYLMLWILFCAFVSRMQQTLQRHARLDSYSVISRAHVVVSRVHQPQQKNRDIEILNMHARTSAKEREARVEELEAEITELQNELGPGEDSQQIVARHIKLLHRYNEAKDAAQIIIGKLASHKQTTIRQIHEDFGLNGDD